MKVAEHAFSSIYHNQSHRICGVISRIFMVITTTVLGGMYEHAPRRDMEYGESVDCAKLGVVDVPEANVLWCYDAVTVHLIRLQSSKVQLEFTLRRPEVSQIKQTSLQTAGA